MIHRLGGSMIHWISTVLVITCDRGGAPICKFHRTIPLFLLYLPIPTRKRNEGARPWYSNSNCSRNRITSIMLYHWDVQFAKGSRSPHIMPSTRSSPPMFASNFSSNNLHTICLTEKNRKKNWLKNWALIFEKLASFWVLVDPRRETYVTVLHEQNG